jgi:5'-nucleotidase
MYDNKIGKLLTSVRLPALALLALFVAACAPVSERGASDVVLISVVATNDVHGELVEQTDRGGLTTFSGYVEALRAARAADGGEVLLIDGGDMWQGTLESNLSEGQFMVEAYNELGYAAAAIGNHEFDFGPVGPLSIPQEDGDDPQGALRLRATEADFPLLAANIIDTSTGKPVDWQNVRPSTIVTVAGIRIGIVGVMTSHLLQTTISANTAGLRVAPLAETIAAQARALRQAGASLVIVTAHAGAHCESFDDPRDLSSCRPNGEILQVARDIPAGLVDHIVAGHVHQGVAHVVNGISITSSYSNTRAFGRVDFLVDRTSGETMDRRVFPPQRLCSHVDPSTEECRSADDDGAIRASYAGRMIAPSAAITAIAERAAAGANEYTAQELGVYLETPITLHGRPESPLGNLMTDAILESSDGDIAIHNVFGGIRANLPEGELTYGSVFRMFPFDNRIVVLNLSGLDLRRIIERQMHNAGRRAGFSGMRVFVTCERGQMDVKMVLADGHVIDDSDRLRVIVNDFIALGGDDVLTPVMPEGGFEMQTNAPLVRDVLAEWFRARGGRLRAEQFLDLTNRRWNLPDSIPPGCAL